MSRENVEVVRAALDAYTRRDFGALRALNHSHVELDWSASRGLAAGLYPRAGGGLWHGQSSTKCMVTGGVLLAAAIVDAIARHGTGLGNR
jgi:hypothetical protein